MTTTAVREKPMAYVTELIPSLLDGTKTNSRRIMKPQPEYTPKDLWTFRYPNEKFFITPTVKDHEQMDGTQEVIKRAPYKVGDRVWVQEDHVLTNHGDPVFKADFKDLRGNFWAEIASDPDDVIWLPPKKLKREHARIFLEITNIRVERLQDISEEDAKAEGIERYWDDGVWYYGPINKGHACPIHEFKRLWNSLHGPGAWDRNDWVWVYEFRRVNDD